PPRCRSAPCWSGSCPSTWCAPAARSAPTPSTPPTPRCSTRWRGSRSTAASRWPTSRGPSTRSRAPCSGLRRAPGCGPRSSRSPSRPPRSTSGSRRRRAGPAGSSGAAAAWSTPTSCAPAASTPRSTPGSRSAWAWSARSSSATASPTCATWSRATCGSAARSASESAQEGERVRVPLSWLAEHIGELPPVDETAEAFVRVGLEIEDVHRPPELTGPIVVGRVQEFETLEGLKKPIRWGQVDVGDQVRGIICGATNFAVGDLVVVTLPGAVLPGGFTISARKTYGHVSDGMIASARELGIGSDHAGILVLPPGTAEPGDDALPLLGRDAAVVELNITPDRGYCCSVRGLARELAGSLDVDYTDPATRVEVPAAEGDAWPVELPDPGCARFVARRVDGVDPTKPSPWWMQRRLLAAGMRPISLVVDVTNYVMLELGQPLHAYDAGRVSGPIVVRRAKPGEKLVTLDDVERTLDPDDLLITDDSGPIGLAGVMGGAS